LKFSRNGMRSNEWHCVCDFVVIDFWLFFECRCKPILLSRLLLLVSTSSEIDFQSYRIAIIASTASSRPCRSARNALCMQYDAYTLAREMSASSKSPSNRCRACSFLTAYTALEMAVRHSPPSINRSSPRLQSLSSRVSSSRRLASYLHRRFMFL